MITFTHEELKAFRPCSARYKHFLTMPGLDDGPIDIVRLIEHNGVSDAFWLLRKLKLSISVVNVMRKFALSCARRVEKYAKSPAAKECNDATEAFLAGNLDKGSLLKKRCVADADDAAADAAYAAADAAREKEREIQKVELIKLLKEEEEGENHNANNQDQ